MPRARLFVGGAAETRDDLGNRVLPVAQIQDMRRKGIEDERIAPIPSTTNSDKCPALRWCRRQIFHLLRIDDFSQIAIGGDDAEIGRANRYETRQVVSRESPSPDGQAKEWIGVKIGLRFGCFLADRGDRALDPYRFRERRQDAATNVHLFHNFVKRTGWRRGAGRTVFMADGEHS